MPNPKRISALLLIALFTGWALRLARLGTQSVWWDEGWSVNMARMALPQMLAATAHDTHPPLYYALLHVWRWMGNEAEWMLRLPSACLGVLTIAAAYLLGKRAGGHGAGALAAWLVALSRFAITWSQEIRMYALAALWVSFALWAALRIWERDDKRAWGVYVTVWIAALHTLYLTALALVVINLIWLFMVWPRSPHRARHVWQWAGAQTLIGFACVPWFSYMLGRVPTWSAATAVDAWAFAKIYWTILAVGTADAVETHALWSLGALAAFLAGIVAIAAVKPSPQARRALSLLLLALLFPALIVYLASLLKNLFFYSPPLAPRYLLLFVAAYAALSAWGIARLWQWRRLVGVVALAGALAATLHGLSDYYPRRWLRDDYQSLALTLSTLRQPDETVILHNDADWPIFTYHSPTAWNGLPAAWQVTPEIAANFLTPLWEGRAGAWLVVTPYAGASDPQGLMEAWLRTRAAGMVEYRYGDKRLLFFARLPERLLPAQGWLWHPAQPRYPTPIASPIRGYDLALQTYHVGDTLTLFPFVETSGPVRGEVLLRDPAGHMRASQPISVAARAGYGYRPQLNFVFTAEAVSGAYTLLWQTAAAPAVPLASVTLLADPAPILTAAEVAIQNPHAIKFAEGIRLVGYDLDPPSFKPGGTLHLTLYWQTDIAQTTRYKVFTHVRGEAFNDATGNVLWGQQDNEPVTNFRPTTTWHVGELIVDPYTIAIDPAAPPGAYFLDIGLYDPTTGERLPFLDEANQPVGDVYELLRLNGE